MTKLRTAKYVRLRRFKAARVASLSSAHKAGLQICSKLKSAITQLEWYDWRFKVIAQISKFIKLSCVWKLINAQFDHPNSISVHQIVLVQRKAQAVMQFMVMMNERSEDSDSGVKAAEIADNVGKYNGCSGRSVYNYYLEYKVHLLLLSLVLVGISVARM